MRETLVHLLLVDDQEENLVVLESLLEQPGYGLTKATTPEQALIALLENDFALIILDVEMPGMNGIELAKLIKERKKTRDIPIIFLTAHRDDERHIVSGYSAGGVDYVTKPLNPVILQSKVAVFADLYRKNRELLAAYEALQRETSQRERGEEHAEALEREIEQRKAAEERAAAANRTKDEFLAMLGHELRNPLAPIVTALSLIEAKGDVRFAKELSVIDRQVQHLERLVDDLLDVTRITQGQLQLKREDHELATLVAKAVEVASPLIESKRHHLAVECPRDGLRVHADATRMAQVLGNLLTNAAHYTPDGGTIALVGREVGGAVEVSVKDSGVGIEPTMLPVVFDLFVQGKRGSDRGLGGLGIGLALVRTFVQMHGGTVEARSEGTGLGAEFVVRLPLHASEQTPTLPVKALGRSKRKARHPRRILLVDDNTDAAELLADMLIMVGHHVVVAHDGPSALDALDGFTPEVALLDIGLPVMDGYELAKQLGERLGAASPRLMAMTGYGQPSDRARSAEASFEHHFVKPVAVEQLLAALDTQPQPAS